jgi:hypothetical protein
MNKIKKNWDLITKAFGNEGENESYVVIFFRLLYWIFYYNGGLSYFFMLNLHKKGNSINEILSIKEFNKIHDKLDPVYYRAILEDKYLFDRFMKGYNFPLAEMLGILMNNSIFWINEKRKEPLDNILDYELDCYCKMITKWGGMDVYKIGIHNRIVIINNKKSDILSFKKIISGATFVLQKTIAQHPDMSRLNSSCVNTVRIYTISDGENVHILLNFLRMGVGQSIVDNVSHGGLGCGIHLDGTLFDTANDKDGSSTWLTHHPDSGVEFKSFKIPFYKEACTLTVDMHQCFHCFFGIGWDIAITESGPVIIEGNPIGDLIFEQTLYGGIRKQYQNYANSYKEKRGII